MITSSKHVVDVSDPQIEYTNPFSSVTHILTTIEDAWLHSQEENARPQPPASNNTTQSTQSAPKTRSRKRKAAALQPSSGPTSGAASTSTSNRASTDPTEHERFRVIAHTFEISFIKGDSKLPPHRQALVDKTQTSFHDTLRSRLPSASEPGVLEIKSPLMVILDAGTRNLLLRPRDDFRPIVVIPPLVQRDFDLDSHDFSDRRLSNVLNAAMHLHIVKRAVIEAQLRIHYTGDQQSQNVDPQELPFTFLLDINVFLLTPTIFEPIDSTGSWLGECQRRLAYYLFDEDLPVPSPSSMDLPRFYGSLHPAPPVTLDLSKVIQPKGLTCELLPFQRRSVLWMLQREGKTIGPDGKVRSASGWSTTESVLWTPVSPPNNGDVKGKGKAKAKEPAPKWWVHALSGDIRDEQPNEPIVGGLLAEEPGLGKTVESISLILFNTPSSDDLSPPYYAAHIEIDVTPIKGTLIVTPPSLLQQWLEEIKTRAPGLKVLVYDGWQSASTKKIISRAGTTKSSSPPPAKKLGRTGSTYEEDYDSDGNLKRIRKVPVKKNAKGKGKAKPKVETIDEANMTWPEYVGSFDVVLCAYNTLANDLAVARPPVKRPRREVASYYAVQEKYRSPLVLVEFERVLMDEVQQVGGGQTAEMVSLIPRRSSFAVSGTPAKAHVKDLLGPLRFLGFDFSNKEWSRLLEPASYEAFVKIFDAYAVRTCKADADGLEIPTQTRYVVPISLGMIEQHFYDQTLERALLELGLNEHGVAMFNGWELDAGRLRTAIRKLRMACIHPQVGALGDRAGAGGAVGPLGGAIRPIGDVLQHMVEQSWQAWMTERRNLMSTKVQRALLIQRKNEKGQARYKLSMQELQEVKREVLALLNDLNQSLDQHDAKGRAMIQAADKRTNPGLMDDDENEPGPSKAKGKGKERDPSESGEDQMSELPASAEGEEHRRVRMAFVSRIREARVLLHRIEFSMGDLYHHFGKSREEEEAYGEAEAIRRSLLQITEKAATKAIASLSDEIFVRGVRRAELNIAKAKRSGIKSETLFDEANEIIAILDEQRELLFKWRDHIYKLLSQKIVSDGGESDGQEYQRALDTQGEVECYLKAYAALLADRREVLNEERTALAAHAEHERKLRHTKAAARAAAAFDEGDEAAMAAVLAAEAQEDADLAKELKAARKDCRDAHGTRRALKSVMVELNRVNGGPQEEKIAKDESLRLRRIIADQTHLLERMANEQAPFRATFNGRIAYFRQLQELSDSVAEIEIPMDVDLLVMLEDYTEQINRGQEMVKTTGARQRYLQYIAKKTASDDAEEEDKECGICNCEFETGLLLACGHIFCSECLEAWRKKGHKACSTCREPIDNESLHAIKFAKSAEEQVEELQREEQTDGQGNGLKAIRYNILPLETLQELSKVESFGQQGAKIQTLIRHLLLIEENDPGSKSIIFSAWADSLDIIEHGLRENGITSVKMGNSRRKDNPAHRFQNDPSIRVMLLHGERENSGLNLTVAKRIMLVEPTVNNSFEIQAIARVDRLGQREQTEVYCYYAMDTVEQNILDNAARRGRSLYTIANASKPVDLSAAATTEKQEVEGKQKRSALKGDFIAGSNQMLEVLFPHLFADVDDIDMRDFEAEASQNPTSSQSQAQPVASSSRRT